MKIPRLVVLQFIEKIFSLNFSSNNKKYKNKTNPFYQCLEDFQEKLRVKRSWQIKTYIYKYGRENSEFFSGSYCQSNSRYLTDISNNINNQLNLVLYEKFFFILVCLLYDICI